MSASYPPKPDMTRSAYPVPPDPMTEPCLRFFQDYAQLGEFVSVLRRMAETAKSVRFARFDEEAIRQEAEREKQGIREALAHDLEAIRDVIHEADEADDLRRQREYEAYVAIMDVETRVANRIDWVRNPQLPDPPAEVLSERFEAWLRQFDEWQEALEVQPARRLADPASRLMATFEPLLLEMTLSRTIDGFVTYLAELMALVIRTAREEALTKLSEKVDLAEVLDRSLEDLVASVVERRVEQLSKDSWRKLSEDFKKRLNFNLFRDKQSENQASYFVALRNAIVHNRAVIDNQLLRKLPKELADKYSGHVGERVPLDFSVAREAVMFVAHAVHDIDQRAAERWRLPRPASVPERTWDFWTS